MSILLEILGRGLEEDLRCVLYPIYGGGSLESVQSLSARLYTEDTSETRLELGLAHWREGQLEEARRQLAPLCCGSPTAPAALAAMAAVCEENHDIVAAGEFLELLAAVEPDSPNVQFARGLVAEQLDNRSAAAEHYSRVLKIDPMHVSAHKRLAAVHLVEGRQQDAEAVYDGLRAVVPEDSHLQTSLGCLQFFCGHYHQAVETFEVVIAMEPENWAADDESVLDCVRRGDVRGAIVRAEHMLDEQGPFADLHLQLANLYSLVGDDGPALEQYGEALSIYPDYLDALIKLATHHLLFDRWEESAEAFGRAAVCSERLLVNYIGMGVSQAAAGEIQQAARSLDLASAIDPNSTLLLTQMIRLHRRLTQSEVLDGQGMGIIPPGEPVEQILEPELRCHIERVTRHPMRPEGHFHLGVLLQSLGEPRQAASEFARAARLHPTHVPAMIKLGLAMKDLDHDRLAARVFHRLFTVPAEQIEAHYRLAVTFTQHGRVDELARRLADSSDYRQLEDVRADLALSLQHMGLLDRGASIWRALQETHRVG